MGSGIGSYDATCIECAEAKSDETLGKTAHTDATCIECAEAKQWDKGQKVKIPGCNLYRVC